MAPLAHSVWRPMLARAEPRLPTERRVVPGFKVQQGPFRQVTEVTVNGFDDLCVERGGGPIHLHVEVKGTTSRGDKVLFTRNEVSRTRRTDAGLALFVLAEVVLREDGEEYVAEGGRELIAPMGGRGLGPAPG